MRRAHLPARSAPSDVARAVRGLLRVLLVGLAVVGLFAVGPGATASGGGAAQAAPAPTGGGPTKEAPITRVLVLHEDISPAALVGDTQPRYESLECLAASTGTAALNTRSGLVTSTGVASSPNDWEPEGLPDGVEVEHLRPNTPLTLSLPPDVHDRSVEALLRNALLPGSGDALLAEPLTQDAPPVDCAALTAAARNGPRTLILSVGRENGRGAQMDGTGLQVLLDTGTGSATLRSPAARITGLALLPDVGATVRASHGMGPSGDGQALHAVPGRSPDAALSLLDASRAFPHSQVIALVLWGLPALVGILLLLLSDGRGRIADVARAAVLSLPLVLGVGQWAGLVPWWRTGSWAPLALWAVLSAGMLPLLAVILFTTRRWGLRAALTFGLGATLVLGNAAAGSPRHAGALLGPDLVAGGRFYGISNHLFGLVVGMILVALAGYLPTLRTRRARLAVALRAGLVTAVIAVAPTMGADVGSALALLPALAVLALLLVVRRPRARHLLWLIGAGVLAAAVVAGVSVLDWLRPPSERSHLGGLVQSVLDGDLAEVLTGKLTQNLQWSFGQPMLLVALLAAVALSAALVVPQRVRWARMARWQEAPGVRPVVLAALVAGWLGWAVNDTGPLVVLPLLGIVLAGAAVLVPPRPSRTPVPRA